MRRASHGPQGESVPGPRRNDPGPAPDDSILLDIAHRDASHWYAVSYQGCVYETRDAGQHWETGYCDPNENALAAITVTAGPVIAGGNAGIVLYENRILEAGFE